MAMEDVGIFRMIPGALIVEPTDATMVKKLIPQITAYKGFTYIRLTRKKTVKIYDESAELTLGKAKKLKEGNQLTVITGGQCVADALEAADILETENISIRVLDMFTIKPLDTEAVWRAATETGGILVVENHSRKGGIGTAVLEVLGGKLEIPFQCMGREDIFGEVGTEQELKERYQLTTQDIVEQARIMLSEKHENNFTK